MKARVLKLTKVEALAAANVIFPALLKENVDRWKDTLRSNQEEDFGQDVLYDLTREYLDLVNHLMEGVEREALEGPPEDDEGLPAARP